MRHLVRVTAELRDEESDETFVRHFFAFVRAVGAHGEVFIQSRRFDVVRAHFVNTAGFLRRRRRERAKRAADARVQARVRRRAS